MSMPDRWAKYLRVGLDFETYYDDKFTIKKLTPEEYIRNEQFQIIGVGVYVGNTKKKAWITGTLDQIRTTLAALPWERILLVNHNMSGFDALILTEVLDLHPAAFGCTLANARALIGGNKIKDLRLASLAKWYGLKDKGGKELEDVKGMRREEIPAPLMKALGDYAALDAELAYDVWDIQLPDMPPDELEIVDLLTRMFAYPRLEIDGELCSVLIEQDATELEKLVGRTGKTKKEIGSNEKLATAFRELGVEPGTKVSPTTGKDTYAFAKDDPWMEQQLVNPDARVRALAEARVMVKSTISRSRLARLKDIASRGKCPLMLTYGRAVTHRVGGSGKINPQNMSNSKPVDVEEIQNWQTIWTPVGYTNVLRVNKQTKEVAVRHPLGGVYVTETKDLHQAGIRDVMCAPDGYKICVADSSNIELRVAHFIAGQPDTMNALYDPKADLYCMFAEDLYNRPITKADKKERTHGKVGMLQLQYQAGWGSFQNAARTMGGIILSETESRQTVTLYRSRYQYIVRMWNICQQAIEAMYEGREMVIDRMGLLVTEKNAIRLPGGLKLVYHGLRQEYETDELTGRSRLQWVYWDKEKGHRKKIYGGQLFENICQALARLIVFKQMLDIHRAMWDYNRRDIGVVGTVHDENLALQINALAQETLEMMLHVMGQSPDWWPDLPLKAEGGVADRYSLAK